MDGSGRASHPDDVLCMLVSGHKGGVKDAYITCDAKPRDGRLGAQS